MEAYILFDILHLVCLVLKNTFSEPSESARCHMLDKKCDLCLCSFNSCISPFILHMWNKALFQRVLFQYLYELGKRFTWSTYRSGVINNELFEAHWTDTFPLLTFCCLPTTFFVEQTVFSWSFFCNLSFFSNLCLCH